MKDQVYEALIILTPTLTQEEAASEVEKIKDKAIQKSADIKKVIAPIKKKMSYQINHFSNGYFAVFTFSSPKNPANMISTLRANKNILRIGFGKAVGNAEESPIFSNNNDKIPKEAKNATEDKPETKVAVSKEPASAKETIPATEAKNQSKEDKKEEKAAPQEETETQKKETLEKIDEELDKLLKGIE